MEFDGTGNLKIVENTVFATCKALFWLGFWDMGISKKIKKIMKGFL